MNRKKDNSHLGGLFISSRHTAAYSALVLAILGVVFMGGYFLGKQHAVDDLVAQIEYDSFADQISTSLLASYDMQFDVAVNAQAHVLAQQKTSEQEDSVTSAYYAQLIGYGTRKAAERFAEKLIEKGIPVEVRKRTSVTTQGAESHWYQVVTESFTDHEALQKVTERVAHEENIQGIQIVSC